MKTEMNKNQKISIEVDRTYLQILFRVGTLLSFLSHPISNHLKKSLKTWSKRENKRNFSSIKRLWNKTNIPQSDVSNRSPIRAEVPTDAADVAADKCSGEYWDGTNQNNGE